MPVRSRRQICTVPDCEQVAEVGLGKPGAICSAHLARPSTKPPPPHGVDLVSIVRSSRRCEWCGQRLPQVLVDLDPDMTGCISCGPHTLVAVVPDLRFSRH